MPSTVLGIWNSSVNRQAKVHYLWDLHFSEGRNITYNKYEL